MEIPGGGAKTFQGKFYDEPPPPFIANCEMETTVCQVSDKDGGYVDHRRFPAGVGFGDAEPSG
jgi:hypothetical protein